MYDSHYKHLKKVLIETAAVYARASTRLCVSRFSVVNQRSHVHVCGMENNVTQSKLAACVVIQV